MKHRFVIFNKKARILAQKMVPLTTVLDLVRKFTMTVTFMKELLVPAGSRDTSIPFLLLMTKKYATEL